MPFSSPREHTRHWYFQVVTLCILLLPAAQAAAAGSLTPATLSALVHAKNGTGAASRAALQLRGNNTLVILPVAGVQADVVLRADAGEFAERSLSGGSREWPRDPRRRLRSWQRGGMDHPRRGALSPAD